MSLFSRSRCRSRGRRALFLPALFLLALFRSSRRRSSCRRSPCRRSPCRRLFLDDSVRISRLLPITLGLAACTSSAGVADAKATDPALVSAGQVISAEAILGHIKDL